jgi:hypothetical protein
MTRNLSHLITFYACLWPASISMGATIPAGTKLIAETTEPISTHERVGGSFKAVLEKAVVVNSKVVLPAGTPVHGIVEESMRPPRSSTAVSVNIASVVVHGKSVPVKTTGAYRLPPVFKTMSGVSVSGRETNYPHRTRLGVQLAQPVTI